jgi:hypothetical protein
MRYLSWFCAGGVLGATTGGLAAFCALAIWSEWMAGPMTEAEASDFEFLVVGVTAIATGVGAFIGAVFSLVWVWRASARSQARLLPPT